MNFTAVEPDTNVGVFECVVDVDSLVRVNNEHLAEEVTCGGSCEALMFGAVGREELIGEEALDTVTTVARSVLHVIAHRLLQLLHERLRGRAQLLDNLVPLVDVWVKRSH